MRCVAVRCGVLLYRYAAKNDDATCRTAPHRIRCERALRVLTAMTATPGCFSLGLLLFILVNSTRRLDTVAWMLLSVAVSTSYTDVKQVTQLSTDERRIPIFTARRCASAVYAVCLSVRHKPALYIKTVKRRITQTTSYDSP